LVVATSCKLNTLIAILLLMMPALALAAAPGVLSYERLGAYAEPMRRAVERPTVHQRVGPIDTPLSLEMSGFLLDHPDMSAWLVRRHKIAPYVIEMRGPGRSWADDGDGTTGFIDLVENRPDRRAYYTEGTHVSALFPKIRASAVILMDISAANKPGCDEQVTSSFDVYVRMRNPFVSGMVKTLRPFIKGVLIRKFTRAFSVARQVGVLLAEDPAGVRSEILSYPGFAPEERETAAGLLAALEPAAPACL
jgi:hypothetical protein